MHLQIYLFFLTNSKWSHLHLQWEAPYVVSLHTIFVFHYQAYYVLWENIYFPYTSLIMKLTYFNALCRISRYGILKSIVPSVEISKLYGFAFFKYSSIKPVMRYLYTHIFIQGGLLTVSWYLFKLFWFHFCFFLWSDIVSEQKTVIQ